MSIIDIDKEYKQWINDICCRFKNSQIKAATKVNSEMLYFYWSIGEDIEVKYKNAKWGDKIIDLLSKDLQHLLPDAHCFSRTNLYYIKKFYLLYSQLDTIIPQLGEQLSVSSIKQSIFNIPWGHHKRIIDKCKNVTDAMFYVNKTIELNLSRNVLEQLIDSNLIEREGRAITNFCNTLPQVDSDLAQQVTRDPYCFDFLTISEPYREKELKDALIQNIERFLLELGSGFAYMGREYKITIGTTERYIDMLFYNIKLECFVVIEVKTRSFRPEDIGQLSAYVGGVNHILKKATDKPTIGLLICKDKDEILAKYTIENFNQPIGISEYELNKLIPENFKGTLPTIQEIEEELKK